MAEDTRFPEIDEDAREHLQRISVCREPTCPVVKKQPFYPVPVEPPLYHGQRPCMPVVPTYATKGKVMLIGEYPNCRFSTFLDANNPEKVLLAPVADINEPFESGRYFDGRTVVNYPTGQSLHEHYLQPLGLSLEDDVWFTNVVKCFLIKATHVQAYKQIGWPAKWQDPESGASRTLQPAYNDYFRIADICVREHLEREVELCQPQLIIAFGERVYCVLHGRSDPERVRFSDIAGVPLFAGQMIHPLDSRSATFADRNLIHLTHPSRLAREQDNPALASLHARHLAKAKQFMAELGLPYASDRDASVI